MIRHSLLLIYRNFQRFKSTFLINLIGLSTGLACALFIYLWVQDELSVDQFHEKNSRLFQVFENHQRADGMATSRSTAGMLAETLAEDMPEVEYAAPVMPSFWFGKFSLLNKDEGIKATGQFVGKDFFNLFSYRLTQGDKNEVLADQNSIVISEATAMNLFGTTEQVVGKTIDWQLLNIKVPVLITGILENVPANSSDQFDFVLSFEAFKEISPSVLDWANNGTYAYVTLREGADANAFEQKISGLLANRGFDGRTLFLQPYADMYLHGNFENGVQAGGRIAYVKLFSIIAIFILVIACINFMNLSTAKASRRIKEVGVKKAIGASRLNLIVQYMGESTVLAFLSLMLATIIVQLLLPEFNQITGKSLALKPDLRLILSFVSVALFTGFVSGSYPALYLSGFNPMRVLKGSSGSFGQNTGELWARKGLVVLQFTLSVIFMVSVIVIYQQIDYIQTKNLGYDKDNMVTFPIEGKVADNPETFLTALRQIHTVLTASSMSNNMVGAKNSTGGLQWEGNDRQDINFEVITANYGLLETLGMEMASGRSFSKDFSADTATIIFNEAAIAAMGLQDPIGKTVRLWGEDKTIIGVVKDFHFESLHEAVRPLFFRLDPTQTLSIVAKIAPGTERQTIGQLEKLYKAYNPDFVLDYRFMDQEFQALYVAEQRVASLSQYFAGLAILISCLGLFGLAAFTAERRLKEIGIRKILGSSDLGIVYLLSVDFTRMVGIAILIALPLSYLLTAQWLEGFAFRIELAWWYFAGAGLAALLIAWFTVGLQTVKAARVNPSECLRDE